MAEATAAYKVIGTRPIRPDGADKVTGRAVYGGDMRLTGMLHGKVLRSPHAHARIKAINTAKAEALPGVKAVITVKDFPIAEDRMANLGEMAVNVKLLSNNVMAADKALYKGHPVAAVAATSAHIAEEALGLIEVEYEVLPPALHVLDAMKETAPPPLFFNEANVRDAHLAVYRFTHVIYRERCCRNSCQRLHLHASLASHACHTLDIDSARAGIQAKR